MPKNKPIQCVETGQVFDSAVEASKIFGVSQSNLSAAAKGKCKTSCGYHWRFVYDNPSRKPSKTIQQMQEEAIRRTKESGKKVSYADIQREQTIRMIWGDKRRECNA